MKITIELHDLSEWAAVAMMAQRVAGLTEDKAFAPAALGVSPAPVEGAKKKPGRQKAAEVSTPAAAPTAAPATEPATHDWPAQMSDGEPEPAPEAPAEEAPPVAEAPPPADIATLQAQVRNVLTKLAKSGKTMAVKSLLAKHGAESMSLLSPEKYAAVLDEAALL
jgi:hypothetical protein